MKRVIAVADHIINTKDTIRKTATYFNISKSTIHKDIQERLKIIDVNRYQSVKKIMNELKSKFSSRFVKFLFG